MSRTPRRSLSVSSGTDVAAEEIDAWDERFELRTMTQDGLLAIARERGMRGYSKLGRGELLEAVEREIYGDENAEEEEEEKRRER